jgi:hypothetical protein
MPCENEILKGFFNKKTTQMNGFKIFFEKSYSTLHNSIFSGA